MADKETLSVDGGQELVRSPDGYWSIRPLPTREALEKHYNDKYFELSDKDGPYSYSYTPEELEHKSLNAAEAMWFAPKGRHRFFEIGVGEGFFLRYFVDHGWDARGVDFTDDGLRAFFPDLLDRLVTGDAYQLLDEYCKQRADFDLVVCANVLEHVLDPVTFLTKLRSILSDGGICRISVPNDGSWLQEEVIKQGYAKPHYFLCPPEHLHYFTVHSLQRLFERCGFDVLDILGEFPIEVFLLNPDSCYTQESGKGRNCHFARVAFELGLWRQSIEQVIAFRRGCAAAGVGRNLVVYARPSSR